MIINGRLSFVNLFEPKADLSGNLKYNAQVLIPKTDEVTLKAVRAEIAKAIEQGVSKGKFKVEQTKSAKFKNPLRDGDEYYAESPGAARESCKGHFFINATNTKQPGVVDRFGNPIMDADEVYSGCYGLADVQFFPFNQSGNVGVGGSLQNVMKKKDGERLDGRQSAQEAFKQYMDDPSAEEQAAGDLE